MVAFRYSEWDGTQEIPPLDPDEVLEALTDDLMNFGDLQHAMRNLLQRGMRTPWASACRACATCSSSCASSAAARSTSTTSRPSSTTSRSASTKCSTWRTPPLDERLGEATASSPARQDGGRRRTGPMLGSRAGAARRPEPVRSPAQQRCAGAPAQSRRRSRPAGRPAEQATPSPSSSDVRRDAEEHRRAQAELPRRPAAGRRPAR